MEGNAEVLLPIIKSNSVGHHDFVVPHFESKLCVRAVSSEDFEKATADKRHELISVGGSKLIFAAASAKEISGIDLFCSVKRHAKATQFQISYQLGVVLHEVYGLGYNQRECAASANTNLYRGMRLSKRCGASVHVADEHVELQQYTNQRQGFPLCQIVLEKFCNDFGSSIEIIARQLFPRVFELVQFSCSKSIMTCGTPLASRVEDKKFQIKTTKPQLCLFGFCNEPHTDALDDIGGLRSSIEDRIETASDEYLLNSSLFCMPTTCSYQFVWKGLKESAEINQYFIMNGLGLGVQLENGITNSFLGSAFSHYTSVAHAVNQNGTVWFSNRREELMFIFAWGKGGGKKELKYNLRKRKDGRVWKRRKVA